MSCPVENTNGTDPSEFWNNDPNFDARRIGWGISGICALTATAVSFSLIMKHCQYYHKPNHQRYIIRIILLVPIYAIMSWLSYRLFQYSVYFETVRSLYEAFVIAAFFALLTQYVCDAPEKKKEILRQKHNMKYPLPCCCITYEPTSSSHLLFIKWGVLQYVIFNPLVTITTLITEAVGVYCSESMSFHFARVYLSIIQSLSITIAMYALATFYVTIRAEISNEKPLYKFACIKLVIFLTIFQNILLSILANAGIIKANQYWTPSNVSRGLNNLLICGEMVLFALLHVIAFDYRRYRDLGHRKPTPFINGLKSAFNYLDLWHEIVFVANYIWHLLCGKELPDSTSEALNIYGAIHADDPTVYTSVRSYSETAREQTVLEARADGNVEDNENKV